MILQWTWRPFYGGHSREEFGCLNCLFPLFTHLARPEKIFLPLFKPKKGVGRRNNNSFGVQEGTVTDLWGVPPKRSRYGLCVGHKAQRKLHPNLLGSGKKKKFNKNSLLSPTVFVLKKKNTFPFQLELTLYIVLENCH
jgi:hypothetical protein